ncbi:Acetylornithine deacetylase [hydrothermal vent metagenome]|uniref:Acetylornithine deacetylase n=1 Tax=hydrothermal vent metagenome TaxID=652676 RepID=A0A3B0W4J2_9ZZZZ
MTFAIDKAYITQTLIDLVRINSVNPSLSPNGNGEAEIGAYVADALNKLGLDVTTYELAPNRVNVVGVLRGKGNRQGANSLPPQGGEGRSLLLNAHMDTVGVDGMTIDPFGAEIENGRLYGRGSQDMKGSLAAMLGVAKAFVDSGLQLAGDLWITAVADEEYASIGMEHLVKTITAHGESVDAAIVTEPTDLTLCCAHRGFIWYDVETIGRAAHGSRYAEGIDANMRMGRFLARLDKLEQELRQRPPHPLAGVPSLHASLLQGGTEISMYAASSRLTLEWRTIPGETEAQATAELQTIIDQLAAEDPTFKATVTPIFQREPFAISEQTSIVKAVEQATINLLGSKPVHTGQTFWTDAALLAEAGIETVLLGPTGQGLHSAEEWVDVQSVLDLAGILVDTAVIYCQAH